MWRKRLSLFLLRVLNLPYNIVSYIVLDERGIFMYCQKNTVLIL